MRIVVVSDIHSNLPALQEVLAAAGEVDGVWCLGDFVGYGPWPNECVDLLRSRDVVGIAGNHDLAALGVISTADFNPDAARATHWTTAHLSAETRTYLESLAPIGEVAGITMAHGSPREPVWEYLVHERTAAASFTEFTGSLCLVGHTHIPTIFVQDDGGEVIGGYMEAGTSLELRDLRAIANPGSVGQPRDRDPRAAYLLIDTEARTLTWHRVDYDIRATQACIVQTGLPQFFADRLTRGV
ncbi:MAG: hypothetical protein QOF51_3667 [Chloroflexota bacterium]|jgi:diadenosine tetraphosphatase ApaH/serine/threonine PP2A family protein phosphatase|nr:hypothetical protein [Chloroflexota bacterium]